MNARKKLLGDYHVGKTIGQGAFSKVKVGFHRETGEKVAIKIIDKKNMAEKAAKAKTQQDERDKRKKAEEERRRALVKKAVPGGKDTGQYVIIPQFIPHNGQSPFTAEVPTSDPIAMAQGVGPAVEDKQERHLDENGQPVEGQDFNVVYRVAIGVDQQQYFVPIQMVGPDGQVIDILPDGVQTMEQVTQSEHTTGKGPEEASASVTITTTTPASVTPKPDSPSISPPSATASPDPFDPCNQALGHLPSANEENSSSQKIAVPNTTREDYMPDFVKRLQVEVQLLMRLDHHHVIKVYQVLETDDECFIIMEYVSGGELIDYIASKGRLQEVEARKYFRQMISALDHCHLANVVHRDIKMENLLLNSDRNLIISDFGLGRTFRSDVDDYMKTFCGTPNYAAIELISGIPYIGVRSDIWATGVILYVMMTGKPPFHGENIAALYSKIKAIEYNVPDYFSEDLKNLLKKILTKEPSERITMEELRNDLWVNNGESGPPARDPPKCMGHGQAVNPTQFIKGITFDENCIIYTFRQHQAPENPLLSSVTTNSTPSTQRQRRASVASPPSATFDSPKSGSTHIRSSTTTTDPGSVTRRKSLNEHRARHTKAWSPTKSGFSEGDTEEEEGSDTVSNLSSEVNTQLPDAFVQAKSNLLRRMSVHDPNVLQQAAASGIISHALDNRRKLSITTSPANSSLAEKRSSLVAGSLSPTNTMYDSNSSQASSAVEPEINFHRRMSMPSVSLMGNPPRQPSDLPTGNDATNTRAGVIKGIIGLPVRPFITLGEKKFDISEIVTNMDAIQPSQQKIQEWHLIHKPPKQIRSVRFSFNSSTTSELAPSTIFQDVHRVLILLQGKFPNQLAFQRIEDFYVFNCSLKRPIAEESVNFEIEVCKVWLMKMHGVKIKRLGGNALMFKGVYEEISSELRI